MKMEKDKLELDKKNSEIVTSGQNQDEDNDSYLEQMGLSARTAVFKIFCKRANCDAQKIPEA